MNCGSCEKEVAVYESFNGRCAKCHAAFLEASALGTTVDQLSENRAVQRQKAEEQKKDEIARAMAPYVSANAAASAVSNILLTTETAHDLPVAERLEIVTAEVVAGMNIFKDFFAGVRNVVGGRSGVIQNALRDIRIKVLEELKQEAANVGANAVVGVNLDYQEIGATGSTMLFVVASGTAVTLKTSGVVEEAT